MKPLQLLFDFDFNADHNHQEAATAAAPSLPTPTAPADPFAAEYEDMRRNRPAWTRPPARIRRIRVVTHHTYPIQNCLRCLNQRTVNNKPCPACVQETWARP